jgi:hypothetical protein
MPRPYREAMVVMVSDDGGETRYSTIEEFRGALADAPGLAGLIGVAGEAVATTDPEREAIVLESCQEAVSGFLVRDAEVVTLGSLVFVSRNYRTLSSRNPGREIRTKPCSLLCQFAFVKFCPAARRRYSLPRTI